MKWLGMHRRTSPTDPRPGVSVLAVNNRYAVDGENRRRTGKASTNVPKQSGAVLNIQPPIGPNGAIIVFPTGGTINGYQNPRANWDDAKEDGTSDTGWSFPAASPTIGWALPYNHVGGTVLLNAYKSGTFPSNGQGATFTVFFDGVLSYTSLCMTTGSDTTSIPVGVQFVTVNCVLGCNGGAEPTTVDASAYGP